MLLHPLAFCLVVGTWVLTTFEMVGDVNKSGPYFSSEMMILLLIKVQNCVILFCNFAFVCHLEYSGESAVLLRPGPFTTYCCMV